MNSEKLHNATQSKQWYENQDHQNEFVSLINQEGFLLEDRIYSSLINRYKLAKVYFRDVLEAPKFREDHRVEIDVWLHLENIIFIIEAKSSSFDWVFISKDDEEKNIHFIYQNSNAIKVSNVKKNNIEVVSSNIIEVMPAIKIQNNNLLARSRRDDYTRQSVRQTLFATEALINHWIQTNDLSYQQNSQVRFVPIVVTNANLISAKYNSEDVDNKAQLKNNSLEFKQINYAAFTHSEILKTGTNDYQEFEHIGESTLNNQMHSDRKFANSQNKTVFIVNHNNLLEFIEQITLILNN